MPIGLGAGLGIGGGRSATSSGAPSGGGVLLNALSANFDGTDDYLDLGSSTFANTGSAFSVATWFKLDSLTSYPCICLLKTNHGQGLIIATSNTSVYKGIWFGSAPTGTTTGFKGFSTNNSSLATTISSGWHHLAFTFDGVDQQAASSFAVYIDGSAVTCTYAVGIGSYSNVNYIGHGNQSYFRFDGLIDEFAIFDSELSASDVSDIYNGGTPASLTSYSPVGWWRMGDGTGDTNSGGGAPANGDVIGTVVNQGSASSSDATSVNSPEYSSTVP